MSAGAGEPVPGCSIVIPVYNRAELTRGCLKTLDAGREQEPAFEVIVVDDGSTDGTAALLAEWGERVRVVRHELNAGFAASCNDGARVARGELLVFLNNDTIPQPGWLAALVRHADAHPEAAVVGGKLLFPDGSVQHAGVVICQDRCPRHVYAGFPGNHPAVNKSRPFPIVTAACALVRRSLFEEVGGFDVAFVNGYEDADLCLRLRERGHEIHYCHECVVAHLESVTRGSAGWTYGLELFQRRWGDHVVPDDLRYYAEDGLLWFEYDAIYPFRILASPELTVVRQPTTAIDDLLDRRAFERQTLLKENIRLTAELLAAAPEAPRPGSPDSREKSAVGGVQILRRDVRSLAGSDGERLVTVIVPGREGTAAAESIETVLAQRAECRVELLVVDASGQSPAGARNAAAAQAGGDACVFLEPGAVPAGEQWLAGLLEALDTDERLAGVSSRVLAREDASVLTRIEVEQSPGAASEPSTRGLAGSGDYATLTPDARRSLLAFSTAGAALRTSVLAQIPFAGTNLVASELAWARDVLEAGFLLRHEPRCVVRFSRERTLAQVLEDAAALGAAEAEILGRSFAASQVVPAIFALARGDWEELARAGLAADELEHERLAAVLRRTAECAGQWLGANARRDGLAGILGPPQLEE